MMARHQDLLTRVEAAAYLGVKPTTLAHGWGPKPLPQYRRPVYYSRAACDRWLAEGAQCSTVEAEFTGSNSSTPDSVTESQRIRQIERRLMRRVVASASPPRIAPVLVDAPKGSR